MRQQNKWYININKNRKTAYPDIFFTEAIFKGRLPVANNKTEKLN